MDALVKTSDEPFLIDMTRSAVRGFGFGLGWCLATAVTVVVFAPLFIRGVLASTRRTFKRVRRFFNRANN